MKPIIEIKSALIGFGLGIAAVLGIASVFPTKSVGRYQVAVAAPTDSGAFYAVILDTCSGQAWGTWVLRARHGDASFYAPKTDAHSAQ